MAPIVRENKEIFNVDLNFGRDLLEWMPIRILLVEDDKGIIRFVKKGLFENSFSVEVASDGEEGFIKEFSFFCI
jgi:hypothetical protein